MFGAGTDTSSSTTEWAMTEMMRNPKIMEKAQAEIREAFKGKKVTEDSDMEQLSYLKLVIKETLRLHPPLPLLLPRERRENCKIVGYDIPIKTQVVVNAWAIGRDPNYWYDADKFIPERFQGNCNVDFRGTNFEFIPFGAGRRMCPGYNLAIFHLEYFVANLIWNFKWKSSSSNGDVDLSEKHHQGTTTMKYPLQVYLSPRL